MSWFMTYHRVCNKINTTGATCGAGIAYPSRKSEFTSVFSGIRLARSVIFYVMFLLIVACHFVLFIWILCCLSFDLLLLISPLVSSNLSYIIVLLLVSCMNTLVCVVLLLLFRLSDGNFLFNTFCQIMVVSFIGGGNLYIGK